MALLLGGAVVAPAIENATVTESDSTVEQGAADQNGGAPKGRSSAKRRDPSEPKSATSPQIAGQCFALVVPNLIGPVVVPQQAVADHPETRQEEAKPVA